MGMTAQEREKRNEEIVRAVAEGGETYDEIAKRYNLTRARIDQIVQHSPNGDAARKTHRQRKAAPKMEVLEQAIAEKLTYKEIADKFGRDQNYWRSWAKRLGLDDKIATAHSKVQERNEAIVAYLDAGHTQVEAAKKFGIGQSAISGIYLKTGNRRRLTGDALEERNESIRNDLAAGMSVADVAEKHGVSSATIYNVSRTTGRSAQRTDYEERNAEIAEKLSEGMPLNDVANEMSLSIYIVRNVARSLGYESRSRICGRDKARRDRKIARDYQNGWTYAQLAKKYNVSIATVYNALKTQCAVGRDGEDSKDKRNAAIVQAYLSGKTYAQIGKEFGVCQATIYKTVKDAGELGNGNARGRKPKSENTSE